MAYHTLLLKRLVAICLAGALFAFTCPGLAAADAIRERPVRKVIPSSNSTTKPKKRRVRPRRRAPVPFKAPKALERSYLDPKELTDVADGYTANIAQLVAALQAEISNAKKAEDPVRLNCLLDKYFQMQNHRLMANKAMARFRLGINQQNVDDSFRHYGSLATSYQAVVYHAEEAGKCPSASKLQNARLQVADTATKDDPPAIIDGPIPGRPPGASPFI